MSASAQDMPAQKQATIETSLGTITVALDASRAPLTVANFIRYAKEKHFDGTVFYRVVPGALIQAGSYDANGKPRAGVHAPIRFEGDNGLKNVRGAIAMAHGDDANSATSEFFIDIAPLPSLDHDANNAGFAVFGQVTGGMDVVDKIAALPLGGKGPFAGAAPVTPVVIEKVTIADLPPAVPPSSAPADPH
ncbi:MAG: peptidylprolyl isomerase [Proteobacteria bacterium]|nr:peptidylprolyl isomerase [Pseudomonadota bacterium]